MGFKQDDVPKTVISKDPCVQSSSQAELSVMLEMAYICAVRWPQSWSEILFYLFLWLHGVFVVAPGLSWSVARGTLPGPRIEAVSPALADGFLTTGAPGKSLKCSFKCKWPCVPSSCCVEQCRSGSYWKSSATLTGIVTPEPFHFLDRGRDEFHLERTLLLVFAGDLTQ